LLVSVKRQDISFEVGTGNKLPATSSFNVYYKIGKWLPCFITSELGYPLFESMEDGSLLLWQPETNCTAFASMFKYY
jgi:hypothetical protein